MTVNPAKDQVKDLAAQAEALEPEDRAWGIRSPLAVMPMERATP